MTANPISRDAGQGLGSSAAKLEVTVTLLATKLHMVIAVALV